MNPNRSLASEIIQSSVSESKRTIRAVRAVIEVPLEDEALLQTVFGWVQKWKSVIREFRHNTGPWNDSFEIIAPAEVVAELPQEAVSYH